MESGNSSRTIIVEEIEDESVRLFNSFGLGYGILVVLVAVCGFISCWGKCLMLHFFWKYAPKRPFNKMFVKDQVIFNIFDQINP